MSLTRAIASNTAVQIAGKIISTIIAVLTVAVMTRHLGAAGYGHFTTVISFLQFFGILVDFGLTLTMIRMISSNSADEKRIASNIFTLRTVSAGIFYGAAALIALLFPYPTEVKAGIAMASLSFLSITVSQTLIGIFQKHLAVWRATLAEIAGRVVLLAGAIFAAAAGFGLLAFIAALVAANAAQLILNLVLVGSYVRLGFAFDWPLWKEIIKQSWPIGLSITFNLVYLKGDVIILSLTHSAAEVGLYGAAYKILDVAAVIPAVFMGLALPPLAAAWTAGNSRDFQRKLGRAFDFLSIIALPLAFGAFAVSHDLMKFVAGADFAAAGDYLTILMIAGAAVFWSSLFGHAVVAMGLQRKMIWGYAADAALSLALYLIFIPRFGAIGAAWVTLFSEIFITIATAAVVIVKLHAAPSSSVFLRALLGSAIMTAIVSAVSPLHVLVRILIGASVYAVLLFLTGVITKDTLQALKKPKIV